MVSYRFIAD